MGELRIDQLERMTSGRDVARERREKREAMVLCEEFEAPHQHARGRSCTRSSRTGYAPHVMSRDTARS